MRKRLRFSFGGIRRTRRRFGLRTVEMPVALPAEVAGSVRFTTSKTVVGDVKRS
jgi:hypothetical protein